MLRVECERMSAEPANVTATDAHGREKAIACARSWLENAGVHFDREAEVCDELFGRLGPLAPYTDDTFLRDEMLSFWRNRRGRRTRRSRSDPEAIRLRRGVPGGRASARSAATARAAI